jgi:hypothetical protein
LTLLVLVSLAVAWWTGGIHQAAFAAGQLTGKTLFYLGCAVAFMVVLWLVSPKAAKSMLDGNGLGVFDRLSGLKVVLGLAVGLAAVVAFGMVVEYLGS